MKKRPTEREIVGKCECGRILRGEDAEYWGECDKCRTKLPIESRQCGDDKHSGGAADRRYHGGHFADGEW